MQKYCINLNYSYRYLLPQPFPTLKFYFSKEELVYMKSHSPNCPVLAKEYPASFLSCSSSNLPSYSVMLGSTGCQLTILRPGLSAKAQGHSYGFSSDSAVVVLVVLPDLQHMYVQLSLRTDLYTNVKTRKTEVILKLE